MEHWISAKATFKDVKIPERIRAIYDEAVGDLGADEGLPEVIDGLSDEQEVAIHDFIETNLSVIEACGGRTNQLTFEIVCGWDADDIAKQFSDFLEKLGAEAEEIIVQADEGEEVYASMGDGAGDTGRNNEELLKEKARSDPAVLEKLAGHWVLNIERTLDLFQERITKEWDTMSDVVRQMFTPLDGYIKGLRDGYEVSGEKIIEFKNDQLATYIDGKEENRIYCSVAMNNDGSLSLVELIEDMGDIEEIHKTLSFDDKGNTLLVAGKKQTTAYTRKG